MLATAARQQYNVWVCVVCVCEYKKWSRLLPASFVTVELLNTMKDSRQQGEEEEVVLRGGSQIFLLLFSLLCEIDIANVLHVDGGRIKVVDQVREPFLEEAITWGKRRRRRRQQLIEWKTRIRNCFQQQRSISLNLEIASQSSSDYIRKERARSFN